MRGKQFFKNCSEPRNAKKLKPAVQRFVRSAKHFWPKCLLGHFDAQNGRLSPFCPSLRAKRTYQRPDKDF